MAGGCRDEGETATSAKPTRALGPPLPESLDCINENYDVPSRLLFGGKGTPDLAIAFDTLFGSKEREADYEAVQMVLERHDWRAGPYTVGLYACGADSTEKWDPPRCYENARLYGKTPRIVAVVAPFNSGCSAVELEQLASPRGGRLAMVSGTNTYVCLTRNAPGCAPVEPRQYQAPATASPKHRAGGGAPLYARVSVNDIAQAAALAELAAQEGLQRVYVLHDSESYGEALAAYFENAAAKAGLEIVGADRWSAGYYPALEQIQVVMQKVKRARPDAVLLAGLIDVNGPDVIRTKQAVLGPNDGGVKLLAGDGFQVQATIDEAGHAADGMLAASQSLPVTRLPDQGRAFVADLDMRVPNLAQEDAQVAVYVAQATDVVLDAIARSDGSRAGVLEALFETEIEDGLIGDFAFDEYGDTTLRWVTIYRAEDGRFRPYRAIDPSEELVEAAAEG